MTRITRRTTLTLFCALALLASCSKEGGPQPVAPAAPAVKLGFLVKQPEEPWFQLEWKFADEAAKTLGFDLVKIGASDGEKVLAAIDNLATQGAQGFVICTPDVRLGPAIVARAKARNLKLISVDDRFLGPDGQPLADVHYLGISARKIGGQVGRALYSEMKLRDWYPADTALCAVTYDELDTAKERTDGAIEYIRDTGFPAERIFRAPVKTTDIPGALDAVNAVLTQQPGVKHWMVCGMNDNAVLGAVRALEGRGYEAKDVLGIGINGTDCLVEFERGKRTGFFASVLLSARQHGYQTCEMLYHWVADGVEPPPDTRTTGVLIDHDNWKVVLAQQGIAR